MLATADALASGREARVTAHPAPPTGVIPAEAGTQWDAPAGTGVAGSREAPAGNGTIAADQGTNQKQTNDSRRGTM
jgi:hypothetical protein